MLCLCRGIERLQLIQKMIRRCCVACIPCLSKVPPQGMEPREKLLPHSSRGAGLGMPQNSPGFTQWHKPVLESLDMQRQEGDGLYSSPFSAFLQEGMSSSSITLFLSGQGGNKVREGNAGLAPTCFFLLLFFLCREYKQKLFLYTKRSTSYPDFFSGLFLCLLQFELPPEVKCCALCNGSPVPFLLPGYCILGLWVLVASSASWWHFVLGNALRSFCHCCMWLKSHFRD